MKVQIINKEDGSINGWVVSLFLTISVFGFMFVALFNDAICDRVVKIGGLISTIYIAQFGAWLAYRGVKYFKE